MSSHAGVLLAHNLRGFYLFTILPFDLFPFSIGFTELLAVVVVRVSVTEFYIISHLKQNLVDVKVLINVFNLTVLWQTEGIGIWGEI